MICTLSMAALLTSVSVFAMDFPDYKNEAQPLSHYTCDQGKTSITIYEKGDDENNENFEYMIVEIKIGTKIILYHLIIDKDDKDYFFILKPNNSREGISFSQNNDKEEIDFEVFDIHLKLTAPEAFKKFHDEPNDCG